MATVTHITDQNNPIFATGNQIISGTKRFVEDVYIKNLYVTGTETIVNTTNFNVQSPYLLLNLTGGAVDGGIFFVTGSGLTGINEYGPIIGFDHSDKFKFGTARRSDDLSTLNDIAAVQDITNYSGFVNSNFYGTNNPSGFITGIDTSNFYTKNNPSGFITSQNVVFTTGDQTISGSKNFSNRPTVNGTGVLLSGDVTNGGTANFRYSPVSGIYNLLSNNRYSFDTYSAVVTGILPANPQKGDEVELYDGAGTWHLNPLIVDNNGNYIEQRKDKLECNVRHGLIKLIYTTQNNIGWRIYPMPIHNVPLFLPPSIAITGYSLSGITPFNISLTGVNLLDPAQSPVDEWYWDLDTGNGYAVTGQTLNYTYTQTGLYNVTLSGVSVAGFDIDTRVINVIEPLVPIPAIATFTTSGYAPLTIQFSGVNLQTPEEFSPVDHWYWNLSGDSAPEFDQRVISYTFNETGTYTFYLTAANSAGSGVASGIVTVLEVPPITTGADPYSDYVVLLMNFNT